ncbi:MAG TPA: EF-hand domain-containing protein [Sphingomonas sp.]
MLLPFLLMLQVVPPPPAAEDIVVRSPARASAQTPATMVLEPVAMMMASLDADGDGLTSRAEMEAGVRRSFETIDTARTGSMRYLAYAEWALRFLGDRNALPSPFDVDRNSDDQITQDEVQSQFSRLYSRFNTNGDEGISRAELLTFRSGPVDKDGPVKPKSKRNGPEAAPRDGRR